jgi:hypothetical protein
MRYTSPEDDLGSKIAVSLLGNCVENTIKKDF